MKRHSLIFVLVILLAGCAVGPTSTPSYAQGYGGYNYPPPPSNPYATPWVGANTPWVFYQGDWFLNGLLYSFFGNQYGWAPYYSYPPTYIVRPYTWYEPRWNTWYQHNPHYWQSFNQKYPYWRGHHAGQRYDQNFYNAHHRGQGGGWNQGFHGVRPPGATGPGGHTPGATGPAVRTPGSPGPGGHTPGPTGPAVRTPGATGPAVRGPGTTGPGGPPPKVTGPAVGAPGTTRPSGATGPAVRGPGSPGPGGHTPKATGPAERKPGKTPPAEKKHPE